MRCRWFVFFLVLGLFLIAINCKKANSGNNSGGDVNGSGQHISSEKGFVWESGQWKPLDSTTFAYNNSCLKIQELGTKLDKLTGEPQGDTGQYLLTYNDNKTLHDRTFQLKVAGNWVNSTQETYRYVNNIDSPSAKIFANWNNNQWEIWDSTSITYDSSGRKIAAVQLFGYGDPGSSRTWLPVETDTCIYSADGKLSQVITDIISRLAIDLYIINYYERETLSYDTNDHLLTVLNETSFDFPYNWIKTGQSTFTYSDSGLLTQTIYQICDRASGVWSNSEKIIYNFSQSCQ